MATRANEWICSINVGRPAIYYEFNFERSTSSNKMSGRDALQKSGVENRIISLFCYLSFPWCIRHRKTWSVNVIDRESPLHSIVTFYFPFFLSWPICIQKMWLCRREIRKQERKGQCSCIQMSRKMYFERITDINYLCAQTKPLCYIKQILWSPNFTELCANNYLSGLELLSKEMNNE